MSGLNWRAARNQNRRGEQMQMFRRSKLNRNLAPQGKLSAKGMFQYHTFSVGEMENNVYLVVCPITRDALLIDASDEADRLLEEAGRRRVHMRMILLTHGHPDHWGALGPLRDTWGVPVGVHLDDADMVPLTPNFALTDGQLIEVGTVALRVLHTPGHTPGSICLLGDGVLFSGDTLFPGGPGATKPPLGDFPAIMRSLREKLFTLPDSTAVLPGHGKPTTIGQERPSLDEWEARGW
jgi:glyoxylase-like metal-dependent hydrolase (beta-lactamase superfamily II)